MTLRALFPLLAALALMPSCRSSKTVTEAEGSVRHTLVDTTAIHIESTRDTALTVDTSAIRAESRREALVEFADSGGTVTITPRGITLRGIKSLGLRALDLAELRRQLIEAQARDTLATDIRRGVNDDTATEQSQTTETRPPLISVIPRAIGEGLFVFAILCALGFAASCLIRRCLRK